MRYKELTSGNYFIFDADDEEPNCNNCDNQDACIRYNVADKSCGPSKGWYRYERWEKDEDIS